MSRSWKEIEQVSAGLALLGINDFSGNYHRPPVPQFSHSGITAIQCHPKSPEIPNQVLVQTAFQQQPPHVLTGLMIKKISQSLKCEKSEANNNDSPCRKKKIVDHQQHNASLEYKDEEIQLEADMTLGFGRKYYTEFLTLINPIPLDILRLRETC